MGLSPDQMNSIPIVLHCINMRKETQFIIGNYLRLKYRQIHG